jgi:hypothetical protein
MTVKNHYGKWVNSEEPITGVLNGNQIAWEWMDDGTCLDCEEVINKHYRHTDFDEYCEKCPYCVEADDFCLDWLLCEGHDHIYGDWILDTKTEQYSPDEKGEFAAIYNGNYNTLQVVWSKFTTRAALCSPCYPGQGDVGSKGEFLAFTLPDYLLIETYINERS